MSETQRSRRKRVNYVLAGRKDVDKRPPRYVSSSTIAEFAGIDSQNLRMTDLNMREVEVALCHGSPGTKKEQSPISSRPPPPTTTTLLARSYYAIAHRRLRESRRNSSIQDTQHRKTHRRCLPNALKYYVPDVEDDCLGRVGEDSGEVVGVLLVPAEAHERRQVVRLVDDGGVLQ